MDFLWPDLLLLLVSIPLLLAAYIRRLRRPCRFAVRYSSLSLIKGALPPGARLRRHLPFFPFLVALACLIIALGRPVVPRSVLLGQTTVILALDTSRSMCMRDIQPSRLEAARSAALSFVDQPVSGTRTGIVAFSGFAELAQAPTAERGLLEKAILNLTTATQTAIGSAILRSLDAIAEVDKRVRPSDEVDTFALPGLEEDPQRYASRRPFLPHVIVLLTDGENNTGPSPVLAARQAAERGIRIYSIGFGTTRNVVMDCWSLAGNDPPAGPGTQTGPPSFGNGPDEATLRQIAEMTGGEFFTAASAGELHTVFQSLHTYLAMENREIEIGALFTAGAALLGTLAVLLSFLWHPLS